MPEEKCWGMWYGGSNYALPRMPEDVLEFENVAEAEQRLDDYYWNRLYPHTPCVDQETTEIQVFYSDPREMQGDIYPDERIFYNADGEITREPC